MKDPLDTGTSLLYVVVILPSLVVGHARYFRDTSDTNEEKYQGGRGFLTGKSVLSKTKT